MWVSVGERVVVRVILGVISKLMGACFCVSVFVFAYDSRCIGVSGSCSVCLRMEVL